MPRRLALLAAVAASTATAAGPGAGGALAAGPAGQSGAPAGSAPAPPVAGGLRLYLRDAFFIRGHAVTVPGRPMTVEGVVRPYVPGQRVEIRAFVGRRLIKSGSFRVQPSPDHSFGGFNARVTSPRAGIVRILASHPRSPQMAAFGARRAIAVLTPRAGFGARGQFVRLIQQRLAALDIYVPQTGVYDQQTGLALDAYHRLLGWGVSQDLGGVTVSALLNGRGSFRVRHPRDGKHVEGNLSKQLLALIYGSRVYRIYPISSGKPSTPTITGHFRVYQRTPGYLPDGMYYSSFFIGGYAIHGYSPAPDYAASHGCLRLPIVDAISVYNWLTYGDVVDVYH